MNLLLTVTEPIPASGDAAWGMLFGGIAVGIILTIALLWFAPPKLSAKIRAALKL